MENKEAVRKIMKNQSKVMENDEKVRKIMKNQRKILENEENVRKNEGKPMKNEGKVMENKEKVRKPCPRPKKKQNKKNKNQKKIRTFWKGMVRGERSSHCQTVRPNQKRTSRESNFKRYGTKSVAQTKCLIATRPPWTKEELYGNRIASRMIEGGCRPHRRFDIAKRSRRAKKEPHGNRI